MAAASAGASSISVFEVDTLELAPLEPLAQFKGAVGAGEWSLRIVDAEDPALLYPPCGPGQSITLCMDVLTCGKCQWEVAKPSSSSDRVCTGRGDKRPGARWVHWNPLGLFSMPFPSFTEAHTEYSERLSKDSTNFISIVEYSLIPTLLNETLAKFAG